MTWWEVEQMVGVVVNLEEALDEWSLSSPQMRRKQQHVDALDQKIKQLQTSTTEQDKRLFLMELAERIEAIRMQLTERLKRELPNRS